MRTKTADYLLIVLVLFTWVDDVWTLAPNPQGQATANADDDDFLVTQQVHVSLRSSRRQEPELPGKKTPTALCRIDPANGVAITDAHLSAPFSPAPLYVFMSLQC